MTPGWSYPASTVGSGLQRGEENANVGKSSFHPNSAGVQLLNDKSVLPLLLGARRLLGACLRAAALAQPLAAMSAPGR